MVKRAPTGGGTRRSVDGSWRGTTATLRAADRRDRLMAAGLQLFGTQGYGGTSIDSLCSAAGTSPRYLYESFPTKEHLLVAVFDQVVDGSFGAMRAAVAAAPADLGPRVEAGVEAFVRSLIVDPRRARIMLLESLGVSAAVAQHRNEVLRAFSTFVAEEGLMLIRSGVPVRKSTYTALGLVGATNELLVDWIVRTERPPIEEVIDEIVHHFHALSSYTR